MKFTTILQNNWKSIALIALTITHSSTYTSSHIGHKDQDAAITIIKFCGAMVMGYEPSLSQFFNDQSQISYNDFVLKTDQKRAEHQKKLDTLHPAGPLSTKAYALAKEIFIHFSAAFDVIKQYNGKSSDKVLSFITDMNKVFSPEAAFTSIATKLQSLQKDAETAEMQDLVVIINGLLQMIQQKKAEWNKKKYGALIAGLKKRMNP